MKILVVSGFLGAGKTTFIKTMAKTMKRDFVVMENEYGEVGVDKGFLEEDQKLNIWELTEGCICCSTKSDFASSVLTIANTLDPEYLIVEPTGVGMLSNIIANIRRIEYERISLLKPVTIVDGSCFEQTMNVYPEIMRDQIQAAGTVIVSKNRFNSGRDKEELVNELCRLNPKADVYTEHYSKLNPAWWERLLTDVTKDSIVPAEKEELKMETLGLEKAVLADSVQAVMFLERLVRGEFGNICRAKGILEAGGRLRFDVVGDTYTLTGFGKEEPGKCIFIGNGIRRDALRRALVPGYRPKIRKRQPDSREIRARA